MLTLKGPKQQRGWRRLSLYQFPDVDTPIAETILTLDHSAEAYQAEVAGLSTIPELCNKLYSSLPITPCRCHVFVDNKATLCGVKAPQNSKDNPPSEKFMTTLQNFPSHSNSTGAKDMQG